MRSHYLKRIINVYIKGKFVPEIYFIKEKYEGVLLERSFQVFNFIILD